MERDSYSSVVSTWALVLLCIALIPVWRYNDALFLLLNGSHTWLTDPVWLALTTVGDGVILVIIVGAFLLVDPRVTVMGLVLMLFASVVVNTVKIAVPTLRPPAVLDTVHVLGPLLRSGAFPSGHTASSMSAALSIAYFVQSRTVSIVVIGIGVLISLSRIFVGAHFPRDVVGGMLCAVTLFAVFRSYLWPLIADSIPNRPDFTKRWFRVLFYAEVLATAYAIVVHAPLYAESSVAAWMVSVAVAVVLAVLYFRQRNRFRVRKEPP